MSRLSKDWSNEIVLYLTPDNEMSVSHTCKVGAASPELAVKMLWQALNMTAIQYGLHLNFGGEPAPPVPALTGNGHPAEVP